ncbi:MAG: hypothetical protein U1E76_02790 [Planctomycetota bacterium]
MAHAYTVASFLSRRNHRPDEYGRSLENRMRLMSEILIEVRRRVGGEFAVGVRFDGEECIKDGYTLRDSAPMAWRMARLGADYLSISAGGKFEDAIHKPGEPLYPYTGYSGDRCMPGASYPDGANVYLAAGITHHLRERGAATPVVTTGKIATPALAEQLLAGGKADLIGMARALLADPDWPKKVREGREAQLIRCVYGNVCKNLDENFHRVVCALWPKHALQAPASDDREPPRWTRDGTLAAELRPGVVRLTWERGFDQEGVYGYDVFRSDDGGPFCRIAATRIPSLLDQTLTADLRAVYFVQAYDFAGNRSVPSNQVEVRLPPCAPPAAPDRTA